jgi:hypothetical protein
VLGYEQMTQLVQDHTGEKRLDGNDITDWSIHAPFLPAGVAAMDQQQEKADMHCELNPADAEQVH